VNLYQTSKFIHCNIDSKVKSLCTFYSAHSQFTIFEFKIHAAGMTDWMYFPCCVVMQQWYLYSALARQRMRGSAFICSHRLANLYRLL
jgi:hypothetical protein